MNLPTAATKQRGATNGNRWAPTRHTGGRLSPLCESLQRAFTSAGVAGQGQGRIRSSEAQAFVLTHAIAGVLRTLAATTNPPALQELEDALVMLAINHVAAIHKAAVADSQKRSQEEPLEQAADERGAESHAGIRQVGDQTQWGVQQPASKGRGELGTRLRGASITHWAYVGRVGQGSSTTRTGQAERDFIGY